LFAKSNHARPHECSTLGTFRQTAHVSIALVATEITVRTTGGKDVAMNLDNVLLDYRVSLPLRLRVQVIHVLRNEQELACVLR